MAIDEVTKISSSNAWMTDESLELDLGFVFSLQKAQNTHDNASCSETCLGG